MFSIFSVFMRSSPSAAPALPTITANVTLASSPSRSSVRERARAVWQTLVIAVVWLFIGGTSRAPVEDLERAQPIPAGASVDRAPESIILSSPPIPHIIISSPTSDCVQVDGDAEVPVDVPSPPLHPDPDVSLRVPLELQDVDDDILLPSLVLPIEPVNDVVSEAELAPESVQTLTLETSASSFDSLPRTSSSTSILQPIELQISPVAPAESLVIELTPMPRPVAAPVVTYPAHEPVPALTITPPTTASDTPASKEWNRIALGLPLARRMDKRFLTVPAFWPRLKVKAPTARKTESTASKPRPRSSYLKHFKSRATRASGEMRTSSSAPIPKSRSHESSLVYSHNRGQNPGVASITTAMLPLVPSEEDISTLRSTFYSHADQSLLNYSVNTSTTSLIETEDEQQPTFTSALPTSDTSSTLADLRDPFRYDSIINKDTFRSAGASCAAEPKPKTSAFDSSPIVADCHDPIRYDTRLGETGDKEVSCIRIESDRQVTQTAATSAKSKRKTDTSERCAWWVSTKSASETKKHTGEISNFFHIGYLVDCGRHIGSIQPSKRRAKIKAMTPPVADEPNRGTSASGSASTIADLDLPFRYEHKESKNASTKAEWEKSKGNDTHGEIEQAYHPTGLALSNAISAPTEVTSLIQHDCDNNISPRPKRGNEDSGQHDEEHPKTFSEILDPKNALGFEPGLPVASSWSTISSDMSQFDASDDCEAHGDALVADTSVTEARDILSTDALFAELELCISEATDSMDTVPCSGTASVVVPPEDTNHPDSILAPPTDDLPSNLHHELTSASAPAISSRDVYPRDRPLPPPCIPILNGSQESNRSPISQSDAAKQDSIPPAQSPLNLSRTPATRIRPSKDRVKKENVSRGSATSTAIKHSANKLPARAPLALILPNKEERRSTGPTESSRLKSRRRDTHFVSPTEPPPTPSLPVSLRSTTRALARRGFIAPRATLPPTSPDPPKILEQNLGTAVKSFDTRMDMPKSSSHCGTTGSERRRGLVFDAGLLFSRPPTSNLDSTPIGLAAANTQGPLSTASRLGLPRIPEASGRSPDLPRGSLASAPSLGTISEVATLDNTSSIPRPLDSSASQDSIHSLDCDTLELLLDQFPVLPHAGLSVPRLPSSKRQVTGFGLSGDPQLALANRRIVSPSCPSGNLALTRPLKLVKQSTPGLSMDTSVKFDGYSGSPAAEKRQTLDQHSASAHLASARAAIQAFSNAHQSASAVPRSGTNPLNIPIRGRA